MSCSLMCVSQYGNINAVFMPKSSMTKVGEYIESIIWGLTYVFGEFVK